MAGRGPAPKPASKRARTNKDPVGSTVIEFRPSEAPELPDDIDWHPRTRTWWKDWQESAQAETFTALDWSFLLDTALMHTAMWSKGQWTLAAEVRLRVAKFGLPPRTAHGCGWCSPTPTRRTRSAPRRRRLLGRSTGASVPWRPTEPGEVPTLGWLVLDWLTENLARPETQTYEPFVPTQEQADFILRFYEIDPITGARRIRRGVISRSRGWGKSPFTAGLAAVEALGPVLFAGWDASGQPVGMPWSEIRKPLVEIAAVSEDQVDTNTWSPLIDMLAGGPAMDNYPGLEPMAGFVNLPYGRIQKRTAAAGSAKGAPACFVVCDQTEEWTPGNGGRRLYNALKNNVIKRGGHLLESPNAFTEGSESVAEQTMTAFQLIRDGRAKLETGVLYDHREAPPGDGHGRRGVAAARPGRGLRGFGRRRALRDPRAAVRAARLGGLEHIAASIWEPDADPQVSRSDWLNQVTHASNAWLSSRRGPRATATGRTRPSPSVADREVVTLGFDGSRGRAKGKPDATALIGCRVADGHLFEIGVWEAPADRSKWDSWTPPIPRSKRPSPTRSAATRWPRSTATRRRTGVRS
jgi:hypothetical protein